MKLNEAIAFVKFSPALNCYEYMGDFHTGPINDFMDSDEEGTYTVDMDGSIDNLYEDNNITRLDALTADARDEFTLGFASEMPNGYSLEADTQTPNPWCCPWCHESAKNYIVQGMNPYQMGQIYALRVWPAWQAEYDAEQEELANEAEEN